MSDISTHEEAARRARARLDLNLERLQSELSMEAVVGESVSALRRTPYAGIAEDAFRVVRSNPIPMAIAGAAAALLIGQFAIERPTVSRRRTRPPVA